TADAAGVKKIYLCGITPHPPRKEIDKAALGAVDFVEWSYCEDIKKLIAKLKSDGIKIVALEQNDRSVPYTKYVIPNKNNLAVIVGNEINGISDEILNLSDTIIEIPMFGKKNSLNVAVATGIILYKIIE
ncbi:MAG TPA: TrmH family RNA methyltransferase, partial [Patescibacteria group bacterium]|nr:TrmH family RNA methyltransferase [Patescibacteria group bacterium]